MSRLGMKAIVCCVSFCLVLSAGCSRKKRFLFEGSGTLEATEILVSAKTAGTVTDLAVGEGDDVKQGQVLAKVEIEKLDLQKRQLLAGLAELRLNLMNAERTAALARETFEAAEKKFSRIQSLHGDSSVSQQQYEDAQTAFKASRMQHENAATSLQALRAREQQILIQIELADSQLRDAVVLSPVSGTVLLTYLERGELARPGGPIASVADLDRMWVTVYAKETELGVLRLGQETALTTDGDPQREYKGRITWIASKAEFTPKMVQTRDARSDLVYAVKVKVENADKSLKIGMPVDVRISRP
jgi:HlyD family secretion protein